MSKGLAAGGWRLADGSWRTALAAALLFAGPLVPGCRGAGQALLPGLCPPQLSLSDKAERYQRRIEELFLTPEGFLRYTRVTRADPDSYGSLADGAFHTGIYLSSQALRFAATGDSRAREQVGTALRGLRTLMEVSGKRGLLSRHASPRDEGPQWRPSPTRPGLHYRGDTSRDQYAGFIHGLAAALALVPDPAVREEVAALSAAAADHFLENDLHIVGADGRVTFFGDLRGRILGFPNGVNAAIMLAVAKVAAESTGEERYRRFHQDLVKRGYARLVHWTAVPLLGTDKRVNENMAYLAIYALLLLERDPEVLADLIRAESKLWKKVREERNAFFSFVHAAAEMAAGPAAEDAAGRQGPAREPEGSVRGRAALFEFPDDKVLRPVDLRPLYGCGSRRLCPPWGEPRARKAVPLYLRVRGSSMWVSSPYRLVGHLEHAGEVETCGADYLLAYWMGLRQGLVSPRE